MQLHGCVAYCNLQNKTNHKLQIFISQIIVTDFYSSSFQKVQIFISLRFVLQITVKPVVSYLLLSNYVYFCEVALMRFYRKINTEGLPAAGGGGGSLFPCSLPKLPYVPMFPHSLRMFLYCNFSKFCSLFPKIA